MSKRAHRGDASPARDARREQFEQSASRRWRVTPTMLVGAVALLLALTLVYVVASGRAPAGAAESAGGAGQDLSLPAAQFADGVARFYTYTTAAGQQLRFFVMKSADGIIRAAFDACDTCYRERKGYHQEGDVMICNNCRRSFPSIDINVLQGGCNPAPLERAVVGDRVVLSAAALTAGAGYF